MSFRRRIDEGIAQCSDLDDSSKLHIQKLANAAEHAFADRAILLDENSLLFEQNNEKATRKSIRATVVGSARVMSYEDTASHLVRCTTQTHRRQSCLTMESTLVGLASVDAVRQASV